MNTTDTAAPSDEQIVESGYMHTVEDDEPLFAFDRKELIAMVRELIALATTPQTDGATVALNDAAVQLDAARYRGMRTLVMTDDLGDAAAEALDLLNGPEPSTEREYDALIDYAMAKAGIVIDPDLAATHAPAMAETQVPQFDAKHVSLKQRGQNIILTLELNGVEPAPRYKVIPVNPGVVRRAAASGGELGS
jgi:hypothetical protein